MHAETLLHLAHHQAWADAAHWKTLHENAALRDDAEIRTRLNHMAHATSMLTLLARGGTPDQASMKDLEALDALEAAMRQAQADLVEAIRGIDLDRAIALPRGPKGPFEAPAGILLLQAITHSQHHRGQNASRMRQLGITPPMTDFVIWYATGRPGQ